MPHIHEGHATIPKVPTALADRDYPRIGGVLEQRQLDVMH